MSNLQSSLSREDAVECFKQVVDPELGLDVWTLGLIYEIKVEQGKKPLIKMTFTSPMCPYAPQLVAEITSQFVSKGFQEPEFEYTFDPPWKPNQEVRVMLGLPLQDDNL